MRQSRRWIKRMRDSVNFFCVASHFKLNILAGAHPQKLSIGDCSRLLLREIKRSIGLYIPKTASLRLVRVRGVVGLNLAIRSLA